MLKLPLQSLMLLKALLIKLLNKLKMLLLMTHLLQLMKLLLT
jgi:hypothetical protein